MLLYCIISEMNEIIINVFSRKVLCRSPYISFFEEVYFQRICNQCPHSHIKLSIVDQERLLDVFLNHKGTVVDRKLLKVMSIFFFLSLWIFSCLSFLLFRGYFMNFFSADRLKLMSTFIRWLLLLFTIHLFEIFE